MKVENVVRPRLIVAVKRGRFFVVKAPLFLIITLLALVVPAHADPAHLETWTTNDGTVYEDVKVIRVEDDAVTILTKDGGALVPIFKLPPNLQKRFSYDPVKAKLAADVRAKADAENAKQLQAEIEAAELKKHQQQIAEGQAVNNAQAATGGAATKP